MTADHATDEIRKKMEHVQDILNSAQILYENNNYKMCLCMSILAIECISKHFRGVDVNVHLIRINEYTRSARFPLDNWIDEINVKDLEKKLHNLRMKYMYGDELISDIDLHEFDGAILHIYKEARLYAHRSTHGFNPDSYLNFKNTSSEFISGIQEDEDVD